MFVSILILVGGVYVLVRSACGCRHFLAEWQACYPSARWLRNEKVAIPIIVGLGVALTGFAATDLGLRWYGSPKRPTPIAYPTPFPPSNPQPGLTIPPNAIPDAPTYDGLSEIEKYGIRSSVPGAERFTVEERADPYRTTLYKRDRYGYATSR